MLHKLYHHVTQALPPCYIGSTTMIYKLYHHVTQALPPCNTSSTNILHKLFLHVNQVLPPCYTSSTSMLTKLYRHVTQALSSCYTSSTTTNCPYMIAYICRVIILHVQLIRLVSKLRGCYRPAVDDHEGVCMRVEAALRGGVRLPRHQVAQVLIGGLGRAQREPRFHVAVVTQPVAAVAWQCKGNTGGKQLKMIKNDVGHTHICCRHWVLLGLVLYQVPLAKEIYISLGYSWLNEGEITKQMKK